MIQIQARTVCPEWEKALEKNPKTPLSAHRPASGEMCKHNCGHALGSYWVYQWINLSDVLAFTSGVTEPRQCQLCANVARDGKRLCAACGEYETSRPIAQRVEQDPPPAEPAPAPEVEPKRRGRKPKVSEGAGAKAEIVGDVEENIEDLL